MASDVGSRNGPERHHQENGFDPYLEWFGIPPDQRTAYTLLGIDPQEQSTDAIHEAAMNRSIFLSQHLEGPHAAKAHELDELISRAEKCLCNPKWRAKYDRKLSRRPELLVSQQANATHDALSDQFPEIMGSTEWSIRPLGALQRMDAWVKRNRVVTTVSAGILALSTTLFVATRPRGGTEKNPETPSSAPEFPGEESTTTSAPPAPFVPETPPSAIEKPDPAAQAAAVPLPPASPAPAAPKPATPQPLPPPTEVAAEAPVHAAPSGRRPVPSGDELVQYQDLDSNQTFRRMSVAELTGQAHKAPTPAEQWALYRLALNHARAEGNLKSAMGILQQIQDAFECDDVVLQEKMKTVRAAASDREAESSVVMPAFSAVIGELCDRAEFTDARKFLFDLQRKPGIDRKKTGDIARFIAQIQSAYADQGIAGHEKTLQERPADPAANGAVGAYRCFELGNWSHTSSLRASGDPKLTDLADRVDLRATLPAAERLKLAQDLLAISTPPRPGLVAMAAECCAQAEPKPVSPVEAARLSDLLSGLTQRYGAVLPLVQRGSASSANPTIERILAAGALPPGAIDALAGTVDELKAKLHLARAVWDIVQEGDKIVLEGFSPFCSWAASGKIELPEQTQPLLRSGQYVVQAKFTLRPIDPPPEGYPPDKRPLVIPGGFGFGIPLPDGSLLPIVFDANANPGTRIKGMRRAGFHVASQPDFYVEPTPSWCADYRDPVIRDGEKNTQGKDREYVFQAAVQTTSQGYAITAAVTRVGEQKPRCALRLVAPPAMKGHQYLTLGDNGEGATNRPTIGFLVAGRRMQVMETHLAPLSQLRPSRKGL